MSDLHSLPTVRVELDGRPLPAPDAQTLGEVLVMQQLAAPSLCELRYFEPGDALWGDASVRVGTTLRVTVGEQRGLLFDGEVSRIDHLHGPERGREVRLRAYDRLHRLRLRQPVRSHTQVGLKELATELVGADDLAVESHRASPVWQKLVQFRQTDLDLLTEACARCGAYFIVRDGVLHLLGLDGMGPPHALGLGTSLLEAQVAVSAETLCGSVQTHGWNPWTTELHRGRVSDSGAGRPVRPVGAIDPGAWHLVDEPVQDEAQATALAQSEFDHRAACQAVFTGTAEGDPALGPGVVIEVGGTEPPLAGRYVIASATHRLSARTGFVSELSSRPPPIRKRPWGAIMAIGTVTRVDDPDGLGRIRAVLPAYDDLETDWLAVSAPGAGPRRGLVALPDRGDRVLILFAREDPAQGVVVGGLFGDRRPHDSGVEGDSVGRHTWQAAPGHRISMDTVKGSLCMEIDDGSSLTLSPGKVALVANADLEISAAGKAVVIKGASIDFRKG